MEEKENEILNEDELSEDINNEELEDNKEKLENNNEEDIKIKEEEKVEVEKDELSMLRKNKDELKKTSNEKEALKERLLRITAEYENYRKRTAKEKEGIYTEACFDILKEILPVMDNLERAVSSEGNIDDLKKGIEMTMKGLNETFEKLGVEEIDTDSEFDPNMHQAVMHIEDESLEKNQVVEVFMKGYKRGEKVIRHSVVKVAN